MSARETAILGLDLGTTEVKAGLIALDGRLLALTRSGYDLDVTGVFVNDANSDAAPRYAVAAATLGYVLRAGPWELNGFVRGDNLFGRRYAGSVIVNEGNSRFFEPAPGRTCLASAAATIRF